MRVSDFSVVYVSTVNIKLSILRKGSETKTTNSGKNSSCGFLFRFKQLMFGSPSLGFFCQAGGAKDFATGNKVIILSGALTYSLCKNTQT